MNKLKAILLSIMTMLMPVSAPVMVYAQGVDAVCEGVSFTDDTGGCDAGDAEGRVKGIVQFAIRMFQIIIGIISVFVIIMAGLNYITSAGDSAKTKTARDRILYAAIGLVVVVLAEVIVRFVLNRVESVA